MVTLTTEQVVQIHSMIDVEVKPDFKIEDTNLNGVVAVTPFEPEPLAGVGATTLIDSDGRVAILKDGEILPG